MQEKAFLQDEYGVQIFESKVAGARNVLHTNQGLYYLHSVPAAYRYKNKFIDRVKKHLAGSKDKITFLPSVKTVAGKPYVLRDDEMYCLYRGIREAAPDDEAFATGEALARFHLATGSFSGDRLFLPYSSLGSWPSMWRKKLRRYSTYRDDLDLVGGDLTPVDEYLLTAYTYVNHMGDMAIQYLQDCGYHGVIKETADSGKVAYQNFDDGYILFKEDSTRHYAGEWGWVIDMRARDIGQWVKADVRRNGWDPQRVSQFLEGYNTVSPLLDKEYAVVYALMLYPGRFLKFVDTYHTLPVTERVEIDSETWREKLDDELLYMEEALRHYPKMIFTDYGVAIPHVDWLWGTYNDETIRVHDEASSS